MRTIRIGPPIVCLVALLAVDALAVDSWDMGRRVRQETSDCRYCPDPNLLQYCLVNYDFEPGSWQGWTSFDNTDPGQFWHADDYVGSGLTAPVPISGNQSGWCGGGSAALPVYGWGTAAGYGSKWDQLLMSDVFSFGSVTNLTFQYSLYVDCEPGNDYLVVEIEDTGTGNCTVIDGPHSGLVSTTSSIPLILNPGAYCFRFRFISDDACSDEDGYYNSDGGAHIDDITISTASGVIEFEDFESAAPGSRVMDGDNNGIRWQAYSNSFGSYAGMHGALQDKDPCYDNISAQIAFFTGSIYPSATYPGLFETPYCLSTGCPPDPCQDEMILSPPIDLVRYSTGCNGNQDGNIPVGDQDKLNGASLEFSVYRDLALSGLVFYYWRVRELDAAGVNPVGPWMDRGFLYYHGRDQHGPVCCSEKDYIVSRHSIGDMLPMSGSIQVALGVVDMRSFYSPFYGLGLNHMPAPYFDDVKLVKYESNDAQWFYRSVDLFQDNFAPPAGGAVRADAAIDIDPIGAGTINPRDCIYVTCANQNQGIAINANGPMVFMNVRALWIGPGSMPNIIGPVLQGSCGVYDSDDGAFWTAIQGTPAASGCPGCNLPDVYAFDLNDQLFAPGYMIEYYFSTLDNFGHWSYLPKDAPSLPNHPGTYYGRSNWFEFTCLPTGSSDILFVDDFHDRLSHDGEVQDNFDDAFMAVIPLENQPDRYDVNGPSSLVSNSLGSRALLADLLGNYRTIIWDSGNLRNGTICDGTTGDKSLDCQLLTAWLDQSHMEPGLWVLGDNVAWELTRPGTSPSAALLVNTQCGVSFRWDSYYELSGAENPMVSALASGIFSPSLNPFCVYGSCPTVNAFDCIDVHGAGQPSLEYPGIGGSNYYAAIHNSFANSVGSTTRTIWFGFSYMYTRGCEVSPQTKFELLADGMNYLGQVTNAAITDGGDERPAYVTGLGQNFPNPFNPLTRIDFSLKDRGWVSLRIYDVTGRLVRTLVDGTMEPGRHGASWDGTNNLGKRVSSGIYLYRMEANCFTETKKMILLR